MNLFNSAHKSNSKEYRDGWERTFKGEKVLTEEEMYEKSFERPRNFFKLTAREQWEIDERLGILDWVPKNLTEEQEKEINDYYD